MDEQLHIKQSTTPTLFQLVAVGLIGLVLLLLISEILEVINSVVNIDLTGLVNLVRAIFAGIVLIALLSIWLRGKKGGYVLAENAITLHKGGMMGGKHVKVYNYKDISSLDLVQTALGRKFNYGDIVIRMDHSANNEVLRLTQLENPKRYFEFIHGKSLK